MTLDEMVESLAIWDQAIGCNNCGEAWWGDNYTEDPTLFHAVDCPLYGRRDVAEKFFNVSHIEAELGRRIGLDTP